MGLLSGVGILDATWVLAGPYSSLLLGDLGAEIVKVESRELDDKTRGQAPSNIVARVHDTLGRLARQDRR
jgi:crotonobetainyl-CoA:carnitine CoA-transferase CaiB-like acyl-CoA transferase